MQQVETAEWRDQWRVVADERQVACELSDELVILNMQNGVYYSLNPVGHRIWQLLQAPIEIAQLQRSLLEEYDVDPEQCHCELIALLDHLRLNRMIRVLDHE